MASLVESLSRIASRMELFARGMEGDRRAAEVMLERGRPLDARESARGILVAIPGSPLGLALWADAAEATWLDHEVVEALDALSRIVPWRADVWLRLGRAGLRSEWPGARDALERAASAPDERAASRRALLDLADLELAANDPVKALRWLDRLAPSLAGNTPGAAPGARDEALAIRRAECALALGHQREAYEFAQGLEDALGEPLADPLREEERLFERRALLFARLAWQHTPRTIESTQQARKYAIRAFILDVPGSRELLASIIAATDDAVVLHDLRAIVAGAGSYDDPTLTAAFALAEGRKTDARNALSRALRAKDPLAARALIDLAVATKDATALAEIGDHAAAMLTPPLRELLEAERAAQAGDGARALARADHAASLLPALEEWADDVRDKAFANWLKTEPAEWASLSAELAACTRELGDLARLGRVEQLGAELNKPLVLAIVGEFNAGKSTFINALLGVDVAPTGILPTTATLHRVAWAPDPFARILVRGDQDRTVTHAALKTTLNELRAEKKRVDRVQIYAPIERLRWVEILDTPGFNAPDAEHAAAARGAFDEAHVVLWLLDATAPLKASEGEILKQVRDLGVPILVLLNKRDRLTNDAIETIRSHVTAGLKELEIVPAAPPLFVSAKLALDGVTNPTTDALARSGWSEVETMIANQVVDRADSLRERALRRRAARLAAELATEAATREEAARTEAAARTERAKKLRTAKASLDAYQPNRPQTLRASIEEAEKALAADLRPVGAIGEGARDDEGVRSYIASRAVTRLAPAITLALARDQAIEAPWIATALVSASLEGAATAAPNDFLQGGDSLVKHLGAPIHAFAEALGMEASREEASQPRSSTAARMRSLTRMLSK